MAAPRSALAPVFLEVFDRDPYRHAFPAMVTIRPVSERSTSPEPQPYQFAIKPAVD